MQNTKCRKPRTIQMSYPAPYSQSWANTEPPQVRTEEMKKCASFQVNKKKPNRPFCNCHWQRPQPLTQGSNPYAPHLKYGLFPRKVSLREPSYEPPMTKKLFPLEDVKLKRVDKSINKDRKHVCRKERHSSDAPLFIIRPIDKQYNRQLSLSEMTHVDIKPRGRFPGTMSPRIQQRLRKRY